MQKILVISESTQVSSDMKRILEEQLPYAVFTAFDIPSARTQLDSKVFNLTVIDQAEVTDNMMKLIDWLRTTSYSFPILIHTEKVPPQLLGKLNLLHDIHMLIKPTVDKSIIGLVRKLLVAKRVPKQQYRRFNTNQIAQMEALSSGDSLLTSMYNLSKGGAYFEYDGHAPLTIGDLCRVKVFISDTNNEFTFNAKVVWTTPKGRFSGRTGCGIKFVNSKDTYRSLLSKA